MMMLQKLLDLFRGKERNKRKRALEKIQYLDKRIPLIMIEAEKHHFEQEKQEIRENLYKEVQIEEITGTADDLVARVDRYIRVQEDEDYRRIIEHLIMKDITSELEIKEICNPLDRNIVFKYLLIEKEARKVNKVKTLNDELLLVKEIVRRTLDTVSQEKDAEGLKSVWNYIFEQEMDKLSGFKNGVSDLKIHDLGMMENEIFSLKERFTCLEKYAKEYLSEEALGMLTNEVRDYLPRQDITYEEIYGGLGDPIVTELRDCIEREHEGKMIKDRMAKLIYSRLKKGMLVR